MKLTNHQNEVFQLNIDAYMFSDRTGSYFESNWLKGSIEISGKRSIKRIQLEFLQIEELVNLFHWIETLGENKTREKTIFDFIDPNMRFRVWKRKPVKTIRFIYHSEQKEIYTWEMILNEKNVTSLKCQLDEILLKYPIR